MCLRFDDPFFKRCNLYFELFYDFSFNTFKNKYINFKWAEEI